MPRHAECPLQFLAGMRVPLRVGVCCEVHAHAGIELVYHATGSGRTRLPRRKLEVPFQEQSVIIYRANEPHDQVMNKAGEDWCVQIAAPAGRELFAASHLYVPPLTMPALIEDLRLLSHGYPRLSGAERVIFNLRATTLLLTLLNLHARASRREAAPPPEQYVLNAEQFIREHWSGLQSVPQIAARVGISDHYLRHLFKARRGKTLVRYLNETRVERAKSLLAHSRLPLKQIATLSGFKDEYYFSAVFRALAKLSPGQYRRK
ncbi:MAG: helix-turn-helix transcriptional regulator [Verrucomicrobiales bacterium]|jgi:AraC-like DNA-binding protein|nr:helix-turn-helix transcriptional regulator [Verrucomicrobiales bacterium]